MIIVNGNEIEWINGEKIEETLERSDSSHPFMVVTVNGRWLRKNEWTTVDTKDGDTVRTHAIIAGG